MEKNETGEKWNKTCKCATTIHILNSVKESKKQQRLRAIEDHTEKSQIFLK